MTEERTVFFVSDGTGVTAETLGHSLLTQFDTVSFVTATVPFVDSADKAQKIVDTVNRLSAQSGLRPIIFSTTVDPEVRAILQQADAQFVDFFGTFIGELESELHHESSHIKGKAHGIRDDSGYDGRIAAMNFALNNDDGAKITDYAKADVILVGVSRSGKTPTCLYLALQYGIFAANYPLTEDDLEKRVLPRFLAAQRNKLYGLTIEPARLQQIRGERRGNSRYASAEQCQLEVREAERLFKGERIPNLDTTHTSIEEIAATILHGRGLKRRLL